MDGQTPPSALLLPNEVFRVQRAVFEVARAMGRGFLEAVYQECLALEFASRGIPFQATPSLELCFGAIVVELKVARELAPEHRAQLLNYLRATNLEVGLLVNFGRAPRATVERLVLQSRETANERE